MVQASQSSKSVQGESVCIGLMVISGTQSFMRAKDRLDAAAFSPPQKEFSASPNLERSCFYRGISPDVGMYER
jgi:hypothetical protein